MPRENTGPENMGFEKAARETMDLENASGVRAFIALGSNLGDRADHLREAVARLERERGIFVRRVSAVYETPAHVLEPEIEQPDFLNAVVEVRTMLGPDDLLEVCHRIERAVGRDRSAAERWAARTLDLDLLIFGDVSRSDAQLSVPHPRLGERRFVLRPLADLAPKLHVPPPYDDVVETLLARCEDDHEPVRTTHSLL